MTRLGQGRHREQPVPEHPTRWTRRRTSAPRTGGAIDQRLVDVELVSFGIGHRDRVVVQTLLDVRVQPGSTERHKPCRLGLVIYERLEALAQRREPAPTSSLRLLRRAGPAPAIAGRKPADQPGAAHHGHRPAPHPIEGRAYLGRKKAAGKTSMEAIRCLKRRTSDIVYRHMLNDAITHAVTGPGGTGERLLTPA